MSNLSNQIVKIGHKLHEINMSFAATGEFVIHDELPMIEVKVMESAVTVYWNFIWQDCDWAEADARKIEHDLAMIIQKARESAMTLGAAA